MMSRYSLIVLLLTLLFLGGASSCGDNANKANILPPDIQYTADTMFSHRRKMIVDLQDSICAVRHDSLVQVKVDSFIQLEHERRKAILD